MENKLLVVSPHPDDDVIGMGGTIAWKIDEGWKVHIIYVTNGKGSVRAGQFAGLNDADFITLREKEAQAALQRLCPAPKKLSFQFLRLESRDIGNNSSLFKTELKQIFSRENYKEIYTPATNDRHATHVNCTKALLEVRKELNISCQVFGYEIWSPISFDENQVLVVDISSYEERKRSAIQAHQSQCAILPYDEGIIGKNKYNAVYALINTEKTMDYAELFVRL
jgi:N-acetylglucosamine malate deacetylase 1